jgi:chemotaxis response regulator CheB
LLRAKGAAVLPKNRISIAQDEASSIVFGMPNEAIERGAAEKVVPLSEVTQTLIKFAQDKTKNVKTPAK